MKEKEPAMTTNRPNVIPSGRLPVSMELRFLDRQASGSRTSSPAWLAEVREMRGRVFYDPVLRPSFQRADGSYDDSDAVDLGAYHVIARCEGRAVGCARLAPLANIRSGIVSSSIGEARLESLLRDMRTAREHACEASRWAVLPEFRGDLATPCCGDVGCRPLAIHGDWIRNGDDAAEAGSGTDPDGRAARHWISAGAISHNGR